MKDEEEALFDAVEKEWDKPYIENIPISGTKFPISSTKKIEIIPMVKNPTRPNETILKIFAINTSPKYKQDALELVQSCKDIDKVEQQFEKLGYKNHNAFLSAKRHLWC
ncbi:MAG: hypothetical protein WC934_04900 [Acidithiobacillus sp.]